jgi:putative spermidine/putrescine transport system permease protein
MLPPQSRISGEPSIGADPLCSGLDRQGCEVPGMVAGSLIVFSLTVSSFVTPAILGGPTVKLMPYFVYTEATVNLDWPYVAAIGFILVVVTTALMASYAALLRKRAGAVS